MAEITFIRLKAGPWGLRAETELTLGKEVEVQRKDGSTKRVIVGRSVLQKPPEWWIYEIARPESDATPTATDKSPATVEEWAKPAQTGQAAATVNEEGQSPAGPSFITLVSADEAGLRSPCELKPGAAAEVLCDDGVRQTVIVGKLRATNKKDHWIYEVADTATGKKPKPAKASARPAAGAKLRTKKKMASSAPVSAAARTPRPQDGSVWYHRLKSGEWGLRAQMELTPGKEVEVQRKDGSTETVVVGRKVWASKAGRWIYEIVREQKSAAETGASITELATPRSPEDKKPAAGVQSKDPDQRTPRRARATDDPFKEVYDHIRTS